MAGRKRRGGGGDWRGPTVRRNLVAAALAFSFIVSGLPPAALAQETWRGMNVPRYSGATDYSVETDGDEYDARFRSQDDPRAVFDFYRDYIQQQGFRVTDSRSTSHGFKADMVRGQGGPNDTIELDVKLKHGRHKVEIEFDE